MKIDHEILLEIFSNIEHYSELMRKDKHFYDSVLAKIKYAENIANSVEHVTQELTLAASLILAWIIYVNPSKN